MVKNGCDHFGRVALWLASCALKPKVLSSNPAAGYVQK